MTWNSFFTLVDMVWPVLTWWTRFWPEMTVLTRKRPETHFLSWSTWFDPYWPGELGFGQKWRFWHETARNSFFILVDMVWPVLTWWTRFWSKITVLTRNGPKLIFYPGRHGLTRIDPVDLVLMERCGWLEKNIFLNF